MPDTDLEDMLARMFAPRAKITSQPDDPARLAAVWEEWRGFYALEWWRTDPEAEPFKERQLQAYLARQAKRARHTSEAACPTST